MTFRSLLPLLVGLTASAWADTAPYQELALTYGLPNKIQPDNFTVCAEHGCEKLVTIALSKEEWQQVQGTFKPLAKNAAEERAQIARAIGLFERLVGPKANSAHDKAGDFNGTLAPGSQLDCIDESTNTTTYLTLLEQGGLLQWHQLHDVISRGYLFFGGWPHFTPVIETTRGKKQHWVVDSWFRDNGVDADIVEVAPWKDGWHPEGFSM